ncbi:MAG TPA: helix-turn-helix domain-containing protein [Bryobacteraceae bacterium]|nr:helix-turn-helix domain-containing protein [Bryobacteraceae bacterium]
MPRKEHYQIKVNRVLDYISGHLDGDLSLARLSGIAAFSPFHFHRIFQGITGETLNSHVRRVRLERAALLLKTSPGKRITDAALEAGFAGTAEFSRAFKNHFGCTASSWDRRSPLQKSKICKVPEMPPQQTVEELQSWKAAAKNACVRVQTCNALRYVYSRIYAPYASTRLVDAYHALIAWIAKRGTDLRSVVVIGMSLDDPAITPAENCRYDLGVAFPQQPGGILGDIIHSRGRSAEPALPTQSECDEAALSMRDFEPQQIVAIHCVGDLGEVGRAWNYLYRIWLPAGSYEPADLPAMEMFVRLPEEIGWTTFDLRTCIPVVRL